VVLFHPFGADCIVFCSWKYGLGVTPYCLKANWRTLATIDGCVVVLWIQIKILYLHIFKMDEAYWCGVSGMKVDLAMQVHCIGCNWYVQNDMGFVRN
jgi:hypothetical protein